VRAFQYSRAASVADAVRLAAAGGAEAKFLAGGTTLYDLMKLNVERPATLVDVTAIPELADVEVGPRGLSFGALAKMSDVASNTEVARNYPIIAESLWKAASEQVRNMATVGGNLLQRTRCPYFRGGEPFACNKREPGSGCSAIEGLDRTLALLGTSNSCIANYPGDFAVALVALDAQIDVAGPGGIRTITVEQLYREPGATPHIETVLAPGEFITRIRVPATRAGRASTYHKIRDRESYAFALTSAAVALDLDGDVVREARIAIGGVATRPWRTRAAERMLIGQRLTPELAKQVGEAALQGARPGRHNGFRVELGARTVADALMIARGRA
jgi:xanthine dehydrogenase YagS FAD-binding subunit